MTARVTPLAEARRIKAVLEADMRAHARVCRCCTELTPTRHRYCDDGWQLAKAHARTVTRIAELEAQAVTVTPELF